MKQPSAPILPTATVMYDETPLQYRALENFLAENHLTDLLPKLIIEEITLSVLLTLAADDLSMIAMPFGKRKALLTAIQGAPRVASPGVVPPPAPAAESQLAAERQFALSQQALIAQTQVQAMQSQHNTTAQAVAAQAQESWPVRYDAKAADTKSQYPTEFACRGDYCSVAVHGLGVYDGLSVELEDG